MSSCFAVNERKPQAHAAPAFTPAPPALQRKCACGGQCSSCKSKHDHGGRISHNFGDINVHAEAEHSLGPGHPARLAEIANGETGCDVSMGVPEIAIGQPSICTKHCTEQHEQVHKDDIAPCCKKANTAWTNAKDDKAKRQVQDKMNEWVVANENWLQCRAYKKSVSCADEFLQANCGSKKPEGTSSAPGAEDAPKLQMQDYPLVDPVETRSKDSSERTLLAEEKADDGKPTGDDPKPIDPARCCATVRDYRFHANARGEAYCKIAKAPTPCPF